MDAGTIDAIFAAALAAVGTGLMALVKAVISNGKRLSALEARSDALDVSSEIKGVHQRVDQIGQTVNNVDGQLTQMQHTLGVIHQHLLDGARR